MKESGICKEPGCKHKVYAREYCNRHFIQRIKNGKEDKSSLCSVDGCDEDVYKDGLCYKHYKQKTIIGGIY